MLRAQALAFVVATLAMSNPVWAQASGQDIATAQALFDEGKRLMTANQYAYACPKLVESQRLDPGGGTLFAIALCHEAEGKTATAWADYNVALSEARKDGRKDREQAATEKARSLEPKLTKMRILVTQKVPGLSLTRDGGLVGEAQWDVPLPIDPGPHTFTATAPGKTDWNGSVELRGEGKTIDVHVPALAEAPKAIAPEPVAVTTPTPTASAESSSQKTWAIVAGAAGIASIGIGLGFGIAASSRWSEAEEKCPNNPCPNPADTSLGDSAGSAADVSTVLVGVGAGAVLAGVILWLTAPKDPARALRVAPMFARDAVGLSFGGKL